MGKPFYLYLLYFLFLLALAGLYSCSATKFVPDGEYLLDKVKIESDVPEYGTLELRPYLRQQPNFKMFGLNKTMFQIYNLAGKDTTKWRNRFLQRIGEPPVIYDSTLVDKTNYELTKLFVNKGYIHADVSSDTVARGKKMDVTYKIKGNKPYTINRYTSTIYDLQIKELITGSGGDSLSLTVKDTVPVPGALLRKKMLLDRNVLNSERERLTTLLRNRGYYAFNREYITYEVDSFLNNHSANVDLRLARARELDAEEGLREVPHKKYYFDKVRFYLDYDPLKGGNVDSYLATDSTKINNFTIYYPGKKPSVRPGILLNNNFITPGAAYSQTRENLTYSAFSRLNAMSNIHLIFEEKVRNDSMLLDCIILTMPAKKQSVSFSVEGTNTTGNLGVASSVNYSHRNLFRGAETFNFRIRGAYEAIENFKNPYFEIGGEVSIHIPRFIPSSIRSQFLRSKQTSTEFSLSYNYQTRPEYDRTLLSAGVKYTWQGRERRAARHQLDLLDVDYVYLPRIDSTFLAGLPKSAEFFGYKNQFIVGTGYTYNKSTYDPQQKQRDAYSFRFSIESAGNVLYGISKLFGRDTDSQGSYQLFSTHFAQFVKCDFDYAKTIIIDRQNSIAWRIGGGVGLPYGNSQSLPFEKRYYSGGANSVRGWSVRELGPGEYQPNAESNFFHQSGDIKLDLNIEYRSRFFWKLESAVFVDAGNVWTIKDYPDQKGGRFKFDSFYKQIAIGYGTGFRLDFDFFLIRLDGGFKAYDPSKTGRKRWAILNPNFGSNFAWHIAVGYPF